MCGPHIGCAKTVICTLLIVCVVLLLSGLVVLALLNLDRFINRNHDVLLARAQQWLGRAVRVQAIHVTLWGGIGARLENVVVASSRGDSPPAARTYRG
jgi:hypothetical protein